MKGAIATILAGVEVVGTLLTELPTDLAECKDMQGDLTRISSWFTGLIKDPLALVQLVTTNIIKNFPKVTADITGISTDITKADYYSAGTDVSDIVVLTLGAIPAAEMTLF